MIGVLSAVAGGAGFQQPPPGELDGAVPLIDDGLVPAGGDPLFFDGVGLTEVLITLAKVGFGVCRAAGCGDVHGVVRAQGRLRYAEPHRSPTWRGHGDCFRPWRMGSSCSSKKT